MPSLEGKVAAQQFVHIGKACIYRRSFIDSKRCTAPYIKAAREPLTFAGVNSVGLKKKRI
jgi:UDP-N-acetylglucosamine acyltransferase